DGAGHALVRAIELYRTSHFTQAWWMLTRLRNRVRWDAAEERREGTFPFRVLRYSAWVAARMGRMDAPEFLRRIHGDRVDASSMLKVADHLYVYRFMGLEPHRQTKNWLPAAYELMRAGPHPDEPLGAAVREHVGAWLLRQGRLEEVEDAIGPAAQEACAWRRARIHSLLAELHRRRGELERARATLDDLARRISAPYEILIAEQITPMLARVTPDRAQRHRLLDEAAHLL